ncbi:MAG: diguanylate cyclase [Clostridia bacterium]|jgi:diguanylate cyclase (GGDEF)-like protein/putative nucleotidyltransferase with HDIG domain|nr:diguanylate cyclase [Clostridia bacterium]MDH7572642.1 diguanylate cyclase [Clostridia bacterium]
MSDWPWFAAVGAAGVAAVLYRQNRRLRQARSDLEQKVGELTERNRLLEELAITDGLTGLYNRRYFEQRLAEEISRCRRYESVLALAMIDVDYFKYYNDALGHPEGDRVLQDLGRLLRDGVRDEDVVARYGGDEFAVIFVEMDSLVAQKAGERIREIIEAYAAKLVGADSGAAQDLLTVSVGIASFPKDAESAGELIRKADQALYRAKEGGKNRVVVYHSPLEELVRGSPVEEEAEEGEFTAHLMRAIRSILLSINARDRYTYGHSQRTTRYAEALSRRLGFAPERVRLVKRAALLHDVGKVNIDKEILIKTKPLSPDEKETLRRHALMSAQIIEPVKELARVIPIVEQHHERYDGKGYPRGLAGEQISLEARILAICDAYDAMRTPRPYRDALSFGEAVAELRRGAGTQFDPHLVEVFIEVVQQLEIGAAGGPGT